MAGRTTVMRTSIVSVRRKKERRDGQKRADI